MPRRKKCEQKCDISQCKKCLFRAIQYNAKPFCGYMYYTGKKRPCEPSPNCTAFEKFDKKKRMELENSLHALSGTKRGQQNG